MRTKFRINVFVLGLLATVFGLMVVPNTGAAAVDFGSRLLNEPNYGGCTGVEPPCMYAAYIHPSDPDGDPYSGGAPSDGVIVKFRIRATGPAGPGDPATVTFALARVEQSAPGSATGTAAGFGPTVTVAGSGEVEEFPAQLSVKKGDQLAIQTSDARAIYASSGDKYTYVFSPPLSDNEAPRAANDVTEELLVAATVEPDADGDGFGDETQDNCPGTAGSNNGCQTAAEKAAAAPPKVTGAKIAPKAGKGARTVSVKLSKAAKLTLRVERLEKGRKVGKKCRKQTAKNRSKRACTRVVKIKGRITKEGIAGANTVKIPAKLNGRKLKAGRYRAVLVARDASGQVSRTVKLHFRVTR